MMSKKRLAAVTVLVLVVASAAAVASVTASAKPARLPGVRQARLHHEVPGRLLLHPRQDGAKTWQKTHKNVSIIFAQGKSATDDAGEIAAIQDMVATGVKGIAITPTSPAVIPALNKAVKAGRQGRPDGQRPADLEEEERRSSRRTTSRAARSPASGSPTKLKAGDTLGILEGVPGVPALDDRVNGMLAGLGAMKSQDQGRLEARDRLRPDEGRERGADDADREPEPDGDLLRLRPAGPGRDPVDQERRHQVAAASSSSASTG